MSGAGEDDMSSQKGGGQNDRSNSREGEDLSGLGPLPRKVSFSSQSENKQVRDDQ